MVLLGSVGGRSEGLEKERGGEGGEERVRRGELVSFPLKIELASSLLRCPSFEAGRKDGKVEPYLLLVVGKPGPSSRVGFGNGSKVGGTGREGSLLLHEGEVAGEGLLEG